ncbi:MAG: TonB-dependent receptor plug domain-containing protein [Gemmatimonadales bacterium]|nr:TonB-dependent receptor plug domain-containing protein [Gemmatimonadales bacterium]
MSRYCGLILALGVWLVVGPLSAQVPDSLPADSLAAADTTDYSAMFLRAHEESRVRVPVYPRLGRAGLLPALARRVIERDSVEWHAAQTVSDLITKIPGVYLARGGWVGRPEPLYYQGRGMASAEYLIDGFPLVPLGADSISIDPSLLPLSFFDRVEIERLPGQLRIHLFTRQYDRLPPRTRVGVGSGDYDIARYLGSLERRSRGGFGFVVAADHLAIPLRTGDQGAYSSTQLWLQLSYAPERRPWKAMAQVIRGGFTRDVIRAVSPGGQTLGDSLSLGIDGSRTDAQASLVFQPRNDGLGLRAALLAGYSSWSEDSTALSLGSPDGHIRWIDQALWQFGAQLGLRSRTASFDATAWHRTRWTPIDVRASLGVNPVGPITLSAEGVYRQHEQDRVSQWVTGRAGIALPLGFRATGQVRSGKVVASPARLDEAAQDLTDLGGLVALGGSRLWAEAGYWRTSGYAPSAFPLYPGIRSIGPSAETNWLTVSGRIAPFQWFSIDGWYSNPINGRPEAQPPTHSIVNATLQSRFLPTFRSGIFALKLQGSMESWGTGTAGRTADGDLITLKGATFFRAHIQLKIGDFVAYYDQANSQASRLGYVPDLAMLRIASTFGVRWEFSN